MFKTILIFSVSLFVICDTVGVFKGSTCPAIKLKFGRARYRQKGRFAKFMCNTGYIIAGEKYSTCVNGTWDGVIPKCVRATCKKVNTPVNGLIYPSHRGAVLNFFCKPGFDIRGPLTLYCDGRNWDENLPSCIATNTKPSLSCDFETSDLCGWNHDLRHDFDWTRMNLRTPSGHLGTGPSFDHTLGEGKDGYYMYIEATSRSVNDTARLISPIFDKMDDNNVCFEFFYHMHGASTGELRVYLKKLSDSWILFPENSIFWKLGNHGDKWFHSVTPLGPIMEDFQIIIEGVRGSSFYSDIAIDDVRIIPNCSANEITTESDVMYTDYSPTQSCLNRCDSENSIIANNDLKSCGCDDTCTENNTCCPDYIALCVLSVTDENYTTTETTVAQGETVSDNSTIEQSSSTSVQSTTSQSPSRNIRSTTIQSTILPINKTTDTVPKLKITDKVTPVNTTKNPTTPKLPEKSPTLSPNSSSSLQVPPPKVPNIPDVPRVPNAPKVTDATRPNGPDATRPKIPDATRPKVPNVSEVPKTSNVSKVPNFTKYVARQNNSNSANGLNNTSSTAGPVDEIITVPVKIVIEDDDVPIPVAAVSSKEAETLASSSIHQKIIKEESHSSSTVVIVAIVSVSIILTIGLGIAVIKRYRYHSCNRSRIRGSGSDSQSDVRFLTSDEILDFNMAHPDD